LPADVDDIDTKNYYPITIQLPRFKPWFEGFILMCKGAVHDLM